MNILASFVWEIFSLMSEWDSKCLNISDCWFQFYFVCRELKQEVLGCLMMELQFMQMKSSCSGMWENTSCRIIDNSDLAGWNHDSNIFLCLDIYYNLCLVYKQCFLNKGKKGWDLSIQDSTEQFITIMLQSVENNLFRVSCNSDGWNLVVNKDAPYPTFFHILPTSQITNVQISGDMTVRSV
jgi:hypothetical protein